MKLSEIEALADAVEKCPYPRVPWMNANLEWRDAMNPQTVKAMCALIKQQHEALSWPSVVTCDGGNLRKALAKFEELNK